MHSHCVFHGCDCPWGFGQPFERPNGCVTRVGLGFLQIVQNLMAMIRAEWNVGPGQALGGTAALFSQEGFDHGEHIDIAVQVSGLVKAVRVILAPRTAQMGKANTCAKFHGHRGQIVIGPHAARTCAKSQAVRRACLAGTKRSQIIAGRHHARQTQ